MKLSNDIKYNKIKAIDKELSKLYYGYWAGHGFGEDAAKIARREVWLLANKIYDIATKGCGDYEEYFDLSEKSHCNIAAKERIKAANSAVYLPEYSQNYLRNRNYFWEVYYVYINS